MEDDSFDNESFVVGMNSANVNQGSTEKLIKQVIQSVVNTRGVLSRRISPCYSSSGVIKPVRTKCLQARRIVQRPRRRLDFLELLSTFKQFKYDLQKSIKQRKNRSFENRCNEADVGPWGTAYRVVMPKI